MKTRFLLLFASIGVAIWAIALAPQLRAQSRFKVEVYDQFVKENPGLTADELMRRYPIGRFLPHLGIDLSASCFGDSIARGYNLTPEEKERIGQNGFVVTERLSYESFGTPLIEIFKKDLPVFVSTDAILHALHISYDNILKEVETQLLIPRFEQMLDRMLVRLQSNGSGGGSETAQNMADVELYLTVARRLLSENHVRRPTYFANEAEVTRLLELIAKEAPAKYYLFVSEKSSPRDIDFSQFRPRGHYNSSPELSRYFKAMMWLGRIELYLYPPRAAKLHGTVNDLLRQNIDALMIVQLLYESGAIDLWREADEIIRFLVGESDNVTPETIRELMVTANISSASQLYEAEAQKRYGEALKKMPNRGQAIFSQILGRDVDDLNQTLPATAFMLFGQRFIPDSYVLSNVVFDRVFNEPRRMLPSSFDVLFALGNNGALPLLKNELDTYGYASHLAASRAYIDSYDSTMWDGTFYNSWLNLLRTLNPPSQDRRKSLPRFMQTEAWWRQKMNTQLASWAETRHDNILYAKQSYTTASVTCSYPKSLVEPIPAFFKGVASMSRRAATKFSSLKMLEDPYQKHYQDQIVAYFRNLEMTCDTLGTIAEKELRNAELTNEEIGFLRSMIREDRHFSGGCGGGGETIISYNGWYPRLYYAPYNSEAVVDRDYIVADVHTAPTDAEGNTIGWVLHVGTGPINLAVVTCTTPDGEGCTYIGPVMSYYEHLTTNFDRLTDERWVEMHSAGEPARPAWTDSFLVRKGSTTGK